MLFVMWKINSSSSTSIYQAFDGQTEFSRVFNFTIFILLAKFAKIWCTRKMFYSSLPLYDRHENLWQNAKIFITMATGIGYVQTWMNPLTWLTQT